MTKRLLIVHHTPSPHTHEMFEAAVAGATDPEIEGVEVVRRAALTVSATDMLDADGYLLGTPANLGYMSGALKDFFDRSYYQCLERTEGKPYALYIRGRHDGTGTRRGVETIVTGLRWRAVQPPLILRGDWQESFIAQCEELGTLMAASLEAGII